MTNTKASESVSASVLDFAFFSPPTVHFGCGKAADQALPSILSLGKCTLIVTGSSSRWHHLTEAIRNSALLEEAEVFHISPGEPEISDAQNAALAGAELGADSVIGIGGGSAIDVAKAAAGLIPQPQGVHRYLEVVGDGQPLDVPALPLVAVPATAGTGSEATKNGVLESIQHQRKVSIRHSSMVPNVAIVDPTLTLSAPPASTAASGCDALVQCIEPYLSKNASAMTDALAIEGMRRGARSLYTAVLDGENINARADMSACSLMSGLCLANAGLGAVHGFAGPLGGKLDHAPHGAVCAALLPASLEINYARAQSDDLNGVISRMQACAQVITNHRDVQSLIDWSKEACRDLEIPGLSSYGFTDDIIDEIVQASKSSSSMRGNAAPLSDEELGELLRRSA